MCLNIALISEFNLHRFNIRGRDLNLFERWAIKHFDQPLLNVSNIPFCNRKCSQFITDCYPWSKANDSW